MRIFSSTFIMNAFVFTTLFAIASVGQAVVVERKSPQIALESTISFETDLLRTNLLSRADSELQIRRLRSLLVAGEVQEDGALQRLERLQRQLRGDLRGAN